MKLKTHAPPPGTTQAVAMAMRNVQMQKLASVGGGGPGGTPAGAHEVFKINRDELIQNKGIAAARSVGWRVFVLNGNTSFAAVDMSLVTGGTAKFQGTHLGPFVDSSVRSIATAEKTAQGTSQEYDVRLLEIPAVYLVALWFAGDIDNLFIPLRPAPSQFKAEQVYTEADFFKAAADLGGQMTSSQPPPK